MTLPLWGLLQKAQDNNQVIDEAIAVAVAEHEADPNSHLGPAESLEAHKSEEVIDHPPFSVLDDKLAFDRNTMRVSFADLSNLNITGGVSNNGFDVAEIRSVNDSSTELIEAPNSDLLLALNYYYPLNPRFFISIFLNVVVNQEGRIMVGNFDENEGFGFKIIDDQLWGFYYDAVNVEQALELIILEAGIKYRIEARTSNSDTIEFFVDNVSVGVFASITLPSTNDFNWNIPVIIWKSTTSTPRIMYVRDFYWEADLPA